MTLWDWAIVAGYILSALGIGALFTKKASHSTEDFFVAGRSLPWWIAGTSIVATTFSADTPLFVAGLSRETGIHGNWFWWSAAIGAIASVFFFAKLWRRTGVMTDIEFVVKRYDPSRARSVLRVFKVVYVGVFANCVIMASVTLAMAKILKVLLNLSDEAIFSLPIFGDVTHTGILLVVLGSSAVIYSAMSGLYGVVYTDLIQFALAMVGSIGLMIIVYMDASSGVGMLAKLAESPDYKESLIWFMPDFSGSGLLIFAFMMYMFVAWWGSAPGSGYQVQRLLACRTEKDSVFAFLWFCFLHYVVRSWPWVMIGLLSIIYFPGLEDAESAFPEMIDHFLPAGLKGIMVASLLAAFMSTLDTHLNWGTSYLINDLYEPFVAKGRKQAHYVLASRISMFALTIAALLASTKLSSIIGAYKYLGLLWSGVGTVMIARWYWWRVNPWSEIAALGGSMLIGNALAIFMPSTETQDLYTVRLAITIASVSIIWVIVTLLTSRKPRESDRTFYKKMRIAGGGWKRVADETGVKPIEGELRDATICWVSCTVLIFGLLVGVGKLLMHQWSHALICVVLASIGGYVLKRTMSRISFLSA